MPTARVGVPRRPARLGNRRLIGVAAGMAIGATPLAHAAPPRAGAWTIGRPSAEAPATPPSTTAPGATTRQVVDASTTTVRLVSTTQTATDGSVVVQELEITTRAPGPAIWRVTRGDAEVFVVGGLTPLPHSLAWDERRVVALLGGAKSLLLPPEPKVGVFGAVRLMFEARAAPLPGVRPLESRLPAATARKFVAAERIAHVAPGRYAHWRPWAAAFLLVSDFRRAAGLSDAKPASTIARLARAANVPVRYSGRLSLTPIVDGVNRLPAERQYACLDAAAEDVIWEASHAVTAAQAWSHGGLAAVRANWSSGVLDRCLLQSAQVQQIVDRGTADATRAVDEALATPGRTVAVVDMHFLLRPNGLLDRLRAEGATVTLPPE